MHVLVLILLVHAARDQTRPNAAHRHSIHSLPDRVDATQTACTTVLHGWTTPPGCAAQEVSFEQVGAAEPHVLLRLQCVLGIYYLKRAQLESDKVQQAKYIATAREYVRHAETLQGRD